MAKVNEPRNPLLQPRLLLLLVLAVSSALSVTLSILRIWYSGHAVLRVLNWNLMLAWAPLVLAFVLWHLDRKQDVPAALAHAVGLWQLAALLSQFALYRQRPDAHLPTRQRAGLVRRHHDLLICLEWAHARLCVAVDRAAAAARWFGRPASAGSFVTAALDGHGLWHLPRPLPALEQLGCPGGAAGHGQAGAGLALNPLDYPRTGAE